MSINCDWHKDEEPLSEDDPNGCPECGRMIHTKICESCGDEFLDWEYRGFDDIMAGPAVDRRGDFCCTYCLPHIEADLEQQEEEDGLDFGYWISPYD